jgi:hypothetical protein
VNFRSREKISVVLEIQEFFWIFRSLRNCSPRILLSNFGKVYSSKLVERTLGGWFVSFQLAQAFLHHVILASFLRASYRVWQNHSIRRLLSWEFSYWMENSFQISKISCLQINLNRFVLFSESSLAFWYGLRFWMIYFHITQ